MYGAIIGDIVGSRFEFNNHRSTAFGLFDPQCSVTDDTVCTVAVADWLMRKDKTSLAPIMQTWCKAYPAESYGLRFRKWIHHPEPYYSFGNGAAMRVSPVGLLFNDENAIMHYARESAIVSHNHPEGIKGAQAVALAVFMARAGATKQTIQDITTSAFSYTLDQDIEKIRKYNQFDETCQVTVPQAIICFLQSTGYEHAIRLAVSIGGDSDTIAAITGSIAGAFYGIPAELIEQARKFIPTDIQQIINKFHLEIERSRLI
jgi:ADP-ribosyl-[dinitrogen reductase] hydrolase